MKRLILLLIGILFLLVDIPVKTSVEYPEYEILTGDSYANGKETQAMVMYDVVGTSLKADVLPDVVGFVLFLAAGTGLFKKASGKRRAAFILITIAAAACSLLIPFAPFLTSGESLYAAEYFLGWLTPAAEYTALFLLIREMTVVLECKQNHRDNILIWVGVMASIICGFTADMTGFFQLTKTSRVYLVLEIAATVLYCIKLIGCTKWKESGTCES